MFNPDKYPDRYLVTDTESILYYELLEEQRYKLEINLIKKFVYSLSSYLTARLQNKIILRRFTPPFFYVIL